MTDMNPRLGSTLYWAANCTGAAIVAIAALLFVTDIVADRFYVAVGFLLVAAIVWAVGRAALYLLAQR